MIRSDIGVQCVKTWWCASAEQKFADRNALSKHHKGSLLFYRNANSGILKFRCNNNGIINSTETNLTVSLQQVGEVNRYVFNDGNSYNSNQKISLYTGQTYILKNVPQDHPIAVLNTGKTGKITYSGDNAKKSSKAVTDSSANDTYDFFYGDVSINILDDFGEVSVYGFNDGYMGGKDLFEHRDLPLLNDASVNIINSGGNKYVFNDLQTYTSNEKFALKNG